MFAIFIAIIVFNSLSSVSSEKVTFNKVTAVCDLFVGWLPINITSSNDLKANLPRKEKVYKISFVENDRIPFLYKNSIRNLKFLQRLDLSGHEIEEIEPGALKNLPSLKILLLERNNIEKIKTGVFNKLKNLTEISLERNLIKRIPPRAFERLQNLKTLNLRDNKLKIFHPRWFFQKPGLNTVQLQNNAIYKIPLAAFQHFSKNIFLDGNRIRNISRDIFGSGSEIFRLSLGGNRIEEWDEDLLKNIKIVFFDISYNRIRCLSRNLSNFFVAKLTYIDGNPWSCDSLRQITEWLAVHNSTHIQMHNSVQKCQLH